MDSRLPTSSQAIYLALQATKTTDAQKQKQSTDAVVMVSPDSFQFNSQTADTNSFQKKIPEIISATETALREFNDMVTTLRKHNIRVLVLPSRTDCITPDAVFPNNWFSTHVTPDGLEVVVLYPMLAESRRAERQLEALQKLLNSEQITIDKTIDLTALEAKHHYLEGTGSLVLDRENKIAFAALSPRTTREAIKFFCEQMAYTPVVFNSIDKNGKPIYHTNVVMSVGSQFVVLAAETIADPKEREQVEEVIKYTNKHLITITSAQMEQMAGNILEVRSIDNHIHIVMSQTAFNAFTPEQRQTLSAYGAPIVVHIDTIEKLGGGSARCMLAEIFHPSQTALDPDNEIVNSQSTYKKGS